MKRMIDEESQPRCFSRASLFLPPICSSLFPFPGPNSWWVFSAKEIERSGHDRSDGWSSEWSLDSKKFLLLTNGRDPLLPLPFVFYQVLKGMFGSKEAADEFLASSEGQQFASKLAVSLWFLVRLSMSGLQILIRPPLPSFKQSLESRDLNDPEKRLSVPVYAKVAGTLAAMGASFTGGYFATKEGQDALAELASSNGLEARGKADYGSMIGESNQRKPPCLSTLESPILTSNLTSLSQPPFALLPSSCHYLWLQCYSSPRRPRWGPRRWEET